MFERYTEPSRRAIYYARAEALHRRSPEITTSDLFIGLTREHHDADSPFTFLHERAQEFRELFGFGASNFSLPTSKDIALTDDSKRALAYADEERRFDLGYSLQSDHLLRGLLRVGDKTNARLVAAGVELDAIRDASKQAPRLKAPGLRELGRIRVPGGRTTGLIVLLLLIAAILYLHLQN